MQNRKQRLNLPFVRRRTDAVTWIYIHCAGVFSLVALTLVMAILFIGSKIVVRTPRPDYAIAVDLRTVEEMRREAERLQRENEMLRNATAPGHIGNAVSNEGAELRDDRNTDMAGLRERFEGADERMRGNRKAWESGLNAIEEMKHERGDEGRGERNANSDVRTKGTVQISFSLLNPTRYSAYLYNPGYRCERGGEVTVRVTVNRNGDVTGAEVDKSSSTDDECMHRTAVQAAFQSRFDVNNSAPERHTGTITYIFIPQ